MGGCNSQNSTAISHIDKESTYMSQEDKRPYSRKPSLIPILRTDYDQKKKALMRANVRKDQKENSDLDRSISDVIYDEESDGFREENDSQRPKIMRMSGVKRLELRRVNDGDLTFEPTDLTLATEGVIHEQSSGDEQEPQIPTPRQKLISKAKLLRNVLVAVRKSNQPLPNTFFSMMTRSSWSRHSRAKLQWPCQPISIALCHEQVWIAQGNAITAFTLDLEPIRFVELDENEMRIKHDLMYQIQALTEVSTGQIAVACGSGLHLLNELGRYTGRISEGCYTDAASCQGQLFAALANYGRKSRVLVYEEKDWDVLREIKGPTDGFISLNVSENKLIMCSNSNAAIYITDFDGNVVKKTGSKGQIGTLGHFMKPRVCPGSRDGACLIADVETQQLVALSQTGELGAIDLGHERVPQPRCALVHKRHLYVLSAEPPYMLYKFI